ncbi:hypothetical protein [Deinococcus frigens]|uniref:hypothetical protein n=1 Tax=Deinococcus frigens TaxID=249403 RepID=UPI000497A66F|nr:hypothetical protein [Deinococcus frigens]
MTDAHPLLHSYTPDREALEDAHAFAAALPDGPAVLNRLEDLCLTFAYFHDTTTPDSEAAAHFCRVLFFAASGLTVFLDTPQGDGWATLSRARLWAVSHCQRATVDLPLSEVNALQHAMSNPHLLAPWGAAIQQAGRGQKGGRLAAWWAVSRLLEAAHHLEDGEASDRMTVILAALALPGPTLPPLSDLN